MLKLLQDAIVNDIRRDIATFADPGTQVEVTPQSIRWTQSRKQLSAKLIRGAGTFPDVSFGGRQYTYGGFLASEALADLKDLAEKIFISIASPTNFIPVYARPSRDPEASHSKANELIVDRAITSPPAFATSVLFIHGNAGTGKTSMLTHASRLQAERYLRGQSQTLLLYLDAQGKGLSQLEDVMARALQDLRAKFTYHSVAALTRRHCVVPIVDGFDELIGPSSAREAFANLSQFLAQLEGDGALIASSRSAFIDYKTLHEKAAELAASESLSYEIIPIEIAQWTDESIATYCHERSPKSDALLENIKAIMQFPAGELVRKPFFLSKLCDIIENGGEILASEDITRQVVDAALARETAKLRDQRGKDLLTTEQHRAFCEMLADEMWSLGTPELDIDTIRLLAEIIADEFHLTERDTKTFVDRSIAHGLLTVVPNRIPEKRAFEHELFRFEFQAGRLARLLEAGGDGSRDYVQRGELSLEIVARIPLYGFREPSTTARTLAELSRVVAGAPNNQFSASNAGSLAWALLQGRTDMPDGLQMHGFHFRSHDFGRCCLNGAQIKRCTFEDINMSMMKIKNSTIADSQFVRCVFGTGTRFDGTEAEVGQFFGIALAKGRRDIYDPKEIEKILRSAGATVREAITDAAVADLSQEARDRVDLVERLLTHARNHFYLAPTDSWYKKNLENTPTWEVVERMLKDHRLIEEVQLSKSGRPEVFLKFTIPPDKLLQARISPSAQPTAAAFWQELLAGS